MPVEVPFRFEEERLCWCVDDVYSASECRELVALVERSAPTLATNNAIYRDQDRVILHDQEMTHDLFTRLAAHLPATMGSLRLEGLNSMLRLYRYVQGQRFPPHMDHWYRPDDTRITLHTVLVYFNDDFEGGETRFIEQLEQTVRPKPGRAVVFQHKLRHEGCPVIRGTKYALRTDTVYAQRAA